MKIKGLKSSYTLILTKINGDSLGIIPIDSITSIKNGIKTIGEMTFTVNRYYEYNGIKKENILYKEILEERFVNLDSDATYVIKNIKETNEEIKEVTCYSREKKLFRNDVDGIEDMALVLKKASGDEDYIHSLDEILYDQTGWKLGYISKKVEYEANQTPQDILEGKEVTLSNNRKIRYQESINSNWYDYINSNISEQFECFPVFDSYNKKVNLYSDDELGQNLGLILTYDNYLKSKEIESDTEDIVTRLIITGNDDLTIVECNPSGEKYLEDYSFFINRQEMSTDLQKALTTYNSMVSKRTVQWNELRSQKETATANLQNNQDKLLRIYSKIQALEHELSLLNDEEAQSKVAENISKLEDDRQVYENDSAKLNNQISDLNASIENINLLCKKKYATDNNGQLIFNDNLLNELKEFIYQDTYSNDCITNCVTLMAIGKQQLTRRCTPTTSWSVDSINFVQKLIDNDFRKHWNGELGLGDIILLKDRKGNNELIYFVGYTQNFVDKTIQLELSDKKENNEFSLTISERLNLAKIAYDKINQSQSVINRVKNNRVGLKYDKINKKIL